jgi:hypothetical protein
LKINLYCPSPLKTHQSLSNRFVFQQILKTSQRDRQKRARCMTAANKPNGVVFRVINYTQNPIDKIWWKNGVKSIIEQCVNCRVFASCKYRLFLFSSLFNVFSILLRLLSNACNKRNIQWVMDEVIFHLWRNAIAKISLSDNNWRKSRVNDRIESIEAIFCLRHLDQLESY